MLETRTFVPSLDPAKRILESRKAIFRGAYEIHNVIYASTDPARDLGTVFLRLRTIPVNIWNEKGVVVAIKETQLKEVGKQSIIPLKKEFDTKEEALEFIEKNYADHFAWSYEYHCLGWQYDMGEDQVDLEDIEGHFSIEFKSKTVEGLKNLLEVFGITEVIRGPTVVAVKERLGR